MDHENKNLSLIILEALKDKNLNIDRLSQITGISERFLTLLIEEKFSKLPPAPYVRGYLLKIAEILDLEGEELWRVYLSDNESLRHSGKKDRLPSNRFVTPVFKKRVFLSAVLLTLVIGYIFFRVLVVSENLDFSLNNLSDNQVVATSTFVVSGEIGLNSQLTINGEAVYPQETGVFEKIIYLEPGFNTITFKMKKILGKEYTISKQVFYNTSSTEEINN